jgi:hypothetical protein
MTIREQLVKDIGDLLLRVTDLSDDRDIGLRLRTELYRVGHKLQQCVAIIQPTDDAGPTQADIAGEVDHV